MEDREKADLNCLNEKNAAERSSVLDIGSGPESNAQTVPHVGILSGSKFPPDDCFAKENARKERNTAFRLKRD